MGVPSRKIMVVEDDHLIREAIAEALDEEGFDVIEAANGREALDKLHSEQASLVLLDLMMPVMDGWQFREAQLRDPALAGIPVVVMSASDPAGISANARITKPVELDLLLATIERVARLAQDHGSVCTAGVVSGTCRSATEFMQ